MSPLTLDAVWLLVAYAVVTTLALGLQEWRARKRESASFRDGFIVGSSASEHRVLEFTKRARR